MMTKLVVNASKLPRQVTVQLSIKGLRSLAFRMRLARLIFRLGARVAGVGIEIEDDKGETQRMTRCSVSGEEPINPDDASVPNSATRPDGQHVDHWVMCPGEIIKAGFKRPVRLSYQHVGIPGPRFPLRDLTAEERERTAGQPYVKFEVYPADPEEKKKAGLAPSAMGSYWTQARLDSVGKGCGTVTSMPQQVAETYAAEPGYYGSTFCCGCGTYLKVGRAGEFVWDGTQDRVGT